MNEVISKPNLYEEMFEQREAVAHLLKNIAHESRLMVLCLLAEKEMSVGEINDEINLSQSALSQHLAVLRENNLVSTRRKSQTIYYKLSDNDLKEIITTLRDLFCK